MSKPESRSGRTPTSEARRIITAWLEDRGQGRPALHIVFGIGYFPDSDIGVSRFPIYFPVTCDGDPRDPGAKVTIHYETPIGLDESELPLLLPELDDFKPGADPAGPLARAAAWRFFQRAGGGSLARRTRCRMGRIVLVLLAVPRPTQRPGGVQSQAYDDWMPSISTWAGASTPSCTSLRALLAQGALRHRARQNSEPFTRLVHQGMILGENNQKMSKARGNVINPDDIVQAYGADALRMYEMFMGPLEQMKPWQTSGIDGVRRFLERAWNVATGPLSDDAGDYDEPTQRLVHKTIQKVSHDIEALRFNTAISAMMILVKHLGTLSTVPREALRDLTLLLSPFRSARR